ncbi:unnamed protein product [Rotaria sp. Silwood2]|nr:unnamed protein product [Rotaria sp. Silwood2]
MDDSTATINETIQHIEDDLASFESDSIHRQRRVQSPSSQHERSSITSSSQPDTSKAELPTEEVILKRHLGIFSGVCFIVGIIIGSGIFVSPKNVLKDTKSVGFCLIVWAVCGLLALLGALCYAEIGTVIPRNGAEIAYLKEGIGSVHERTGDILAYLFNWTNAFILRPASIAVLTLTFSEYFLAGIMDGKLASIHCCSCCTFTNIHLDCGPPLELVKMLAIFTTSIVISSLNYLCLYCSFVVMLININSFSVSAANRLNIIFVICTVKNPSGVALSFYAGLWAYDGWNSLNTVTEELKNPQRNLWLSIVLALPAVTVLYVLTNISYFTVLSKAAMLSSNVVAVTWGEAVLWHQAVRVLLILISISALGSANGTLFAAARYCMVGAQYGYLPEVFACIHSKRLTPLPGIVLQGFIGILFCLPSDIYDLIELFSFAAWIFYGLTFVATLCCKFTKKDAERVINVPIPLIIIIIIISIYLVITPVITRPSVKLLYATIIMLVGLVFYYPFVYRKMKFNIMIESNSIHRHRSDQSSITEHRHAPITSVVQPDSLKVVLPPDEPILKRHLDLFSGICFIVGIIIGSGIFVSSQGVLQETQCTFVSFLGTLCYAEIGTVIPRNGAEVAYLKEGTTKKSFGVALAFYKGLFAYGGWHNLNTVTEEIKNPQRNLWLSIVLALPCAIILYILTNISYFTVMNKAELLSSNAVAVTWGEVALGPAVRPLVILISISALGSVNVSLFGAARYCMVGAQYGYLSELFACVQTQRLTPLPGVVFVVVSSI